MEILNVGIRAKEFKYILKMKNEDLITVESLGCLLYVILFGSLTSHAV